MTMHDTSRRGFLGIAGAGIAGAGLASAGLSTGAFAQDGAKAPIAFGYQNTSWGTIGMIAEAENLYAKAGGNVTVYKFDGGKSTRDAMVAGRIDIGVLGATPFIVGGAKGDMVAIGMAMYAGKTLAVMAGTKSGIKKIEDLKGRKVASQLGSSTDAVFQKKILPAFGLTPQSVQIVNVPHQNHIAALASGSVDASACVEPFPSLAQVNGIANVLVDYSKFDITPVLLVANRSAIEQKRAAVVAFLRGWLAAVDTFNKQPDRAKAIVMDHFKAQGFDVTPEVVGLMLSKLDVTTDYVPQLKDALTEEAKGMVAAGQLGAMPDWNKLLDSSLLEEARKGAG